MKRIKYLLAAVVMVVGSLASGGGFRTAEAAESCPDLKVVFARGSGAPKNDDNFRAFTQAVEAEIGELGMSYEFLDLDYPAVGVGVDSWGNFFRAIGALIGSGDAYEFGESVDAGVTELIRVVNTECPETKYVIGGYSQGAMVVSKALPDLDSSKVIYAATFGDPKLYLPEGEASGFMEVPAACAGRNLSEYREYVPDCYAYEGLLGSYRPYQPAGWSGKLGTWCNDNDIFCSSFLSLADHLAYISDNLYAEAAEVIYEKVAVAFGAKGEAAPERRVAILTIDDEMIEGTEFGAAREMLVSEIGEDVDVAAYHYQIGKFGWDVFRQLFRFGDCKNEDDVLEATSSLLDGTVLTVGRGETFWGAMERILEEAEWGEGGKELVVFADFEFWESGGESGRSRVLAMAEERGISIVDGTAMPMAMSLEVASEVEAGVLDETELPVLEVLSFEEGFDEVRIRFSSSGGRTIVILNDAVLGMTEEKEITVGDLRRDIENRILLVPISETRRGRGREIVISPSEVVVPLAPNTGRAI